MKQITSFLLLVSSLFNLQADTIISTETPGNDSSGCLVIYNGQGYRTGWIQADTYQSVSITAKLTSNGPANQTGRAYLTTQIGPGTAAGHQIASTTFGFPQTASKVILFQGLNLPPGTYYLSIIGDSSWGSCWTTSATNLIAERGIQCLGGLGAVGAPSAYFPATPFFSELAIPPELSIQGINVSRPLLQITRNGTAVTISWSTNAVGFSLQSASSPTPVSWQGISQGITINSGRFTFTTNAIGGRFFRLRKSL